MTRLKDARNQKHIRTRLNLCVHVHVCVYADVHTFVAPHVHLHMMGYSTSALSDQY